MTEHLYVATDARGVQRLDDLEVVWPLPPDDGSPAAPVQAGSGTPLTLMTAAALLDELGERVFVAEAVTPAGADGETPAVVHVAAARLVEETAWSVEVAARFALDCAEHVLGDAADAALPDGTTLGAVLADARELLDRAQGPGSATATTAGTTTGTDEVPGEKRLGRLARLTAARRLRRQGELLGDLAFEGLVEDEDKDVDILEDPAWATVATARDALLAAIEALRHLALPRYVSARESTYDASEQTGEPPATPSRVWTTPWGPIVFGAEPRSTFAPAWAAARDAAQRARDTARDRGNASAGVAASAEAEERSWQAARLAELLLTAPSAV